MRLDKWLKVSRLIKRRTVANEACDNGRISVDGRVVKASYEVKPGDILELKIGQRIVRVEVLSTRTPREEKVLKLRFGIEDGRTRTLEEVGKEFNVTRERIRQIEAKALRKLRHPSRSKKLKDFLN